MLKTYEEEMPGELRYYNGWVNVTYEVGSTSGNMAGGRPIVPTSVGLNTNHPDHSYTISLLPDFSTRDCTGSHNDSVRRQCVEQLHGPHNCTVLKHKARRIMLSWGANLSPGRLVQSMITKLPHGHHALSVHQHQGSGSIVEA
ncbi:hypothetical protein NC651_003239 [Populus alba x Populus x berolinensis]|nr:hypothetical protein NC651_003239 [Populus alba x Populus x berolinensis]